jgi:predicted RNA-binding protein with PIN domain
MILLIDAYNLLKYIVASDQATEQEKKSFIAMIIRYANLKHLAVELVFDGGPLGIPNLRHEKNVSIRHSGSQESADDVIKRLAKNLKGHEVLLISTDRELGRYVASHGVDAIDSDDFYRLVQIALEKRDGLEKKSQQKIVKTGSSSNRQLDELMAEHAEVIQKGINEEVVASELPLGRGSSKKERNLEKKLRKL